MPDYSGDHVFIDDDGKRHSICVGPVAGDGCGEKRAYGHIITGEQHATVIVSLVTGEPLYVWHDQISCIFCQRKLTQILNDPTTGKRAQDIKLADLSHPGQPCQRNSAHGPAGAEEHALDSLAKFLLIDPKTNKFRLDDEAILVNHFIADGDTKGPKRFIAQQAEFVPSFAGKGEYLPDIGHFIKCISNALYKLASNSPQLRGKMLLEPSRIRCICSDISKYLREYGDEIRKLEGEENEESKAKQDEQRERCLRRIEALIHHHCGDHEVCDAADCLYLRLENEIVAKYRAEKEGKDTINPKPRSEILEANRHKVDEAYAKDSRFSGISMFIGKKGRSKAHGEISERLDKKT